MITTTGHKPAWTISGSYAFYRNDWLALEEAEEVIEPQLPIVDAHHHLWNRPAAPYMPEHLLADIESCGHRIVSTVYVDCRTMYRAGGPEEFRSIGEVEYANGVAAMGASGEFGPARICEGIVSFGSLHIGERAREVLVALQRAGGERFKGVRHISAWDADPAVSSTPGRRPGLLAEPQFRAGFAQLAPLGLVFDAFLMQPQLPELTALARAFPDTRIVLDHLGTPLGVGTYAGRRDELFASWRRDMAELATCPNVVVKLGGLGMLLAGFDFHQREKPPGSRQLADAWAPYFHAGIELFGPSRCMFESNFPPDRGTCSYRVLWNAFKRIASGASEREKRELFALTACRTYSLQVPE